MIARNKYLLLCILLLSFPIWATAKDKGKLSQPRNYKEQKLRDFLQEKKGSEQYEYNKLSVVTLINKHLGTKTQLILPVDKLVTHKELLFQAKFCLKSTTPGYEAGDFLFLELWDQNYDREKVFFSNWISQQTHSFSLLDHPKYEILLVKCRN